MVNHLCKVKSHYRSTIEKPGNLTASSSLFCPRSLVAPVISLGLRGATGSKDTTGVQPRKQNAGRFTCENHRFHVFVGELQSFIWTYGHVKIRSCYILFDLTPKLVWTLLCQPASCSCSAVLVLSWSHSSCGNAILYVFSSNVVLNCLIQPWFQDCDKSRQGGLWSRHFPGRP